ncbi:MAG: flavin reductase family protein [Chloroflexi bacterium]|nr:flavin reductase family protein [Chloroflexota bacterium]
MSNESELLRQAMRFWATGVTVVTAAHEGVQHGMTVSSFTSVSLTPAQVLVSLAQNARTHDLVMRSRYFGITVLDASQQEISDRFAGRVPDDMDRLSGLETITLVSGAPLLKQGLAQLDCHVVTTLGSGTHTIFIAEVLSAQSGGYGDPLLYFNQSYQKMVKA